MIETDESISGPVTTQSTFASPSYTLSYDANGGTGSMVTQSGSNQYTIHNSFGFTRSGYVPQNIAFNTYANGTGTSYDLGDSITLTGNTTLYAQWTSTGGSSSSGGDTFYICVTHPLDATKKTIVAYTTPVIATNLNFAFTTASPQNVSNSAGSLTLQFSADSAPAIGDFSSTASWLTIDPATYTFSSGSGSFNVSYGSNSSLSGSSSRTSTISYNNLSNIGTSSVVVTQAGNVGSYNPNENSGFN